MPYERITYQADQLLVVLIDRDNPTATVYYQYDDREERPTQYQTADMPTDDQAAAGMVNAWIAS